MFKIKLHSSVCVRSFHSVKNWELRNGALIIRYYNNTKLSTYVLAPGHWVEFEVEEENEN